jgi:ubiquinone/menaquinone biosynthesis C-methylase UbiE
MSRSDVESWLRVEGVKFLTKIGLKAENIVMDFGCGSGHYSLPAAQVVGKGGKVFAAEEDGKLLIELKTRAHREALRNIEIVNTHGRLEVDIPANSVDVILAYDILHYFDIPKRERLYHEFRRILREGGLFSVYPKHNRDDFPLRELANLTLEEVIAEIRKAGFLLLEIHSEKLIHDESYNQGSILNFSPSTKI